MYFINSYKLRRSKPADRKKNVYEMTVERFEESNVMKTGYMVNEYLDGDPLVRPFYDFDMYLDTSDGKIPQQIYDEQLEKFKGVVQKLHPGAEAAYAERCGLKSYKGRMVDYISFRAYIKGYKMRVSEIGQYIKVMFPLNDSGMDPNVYKGNDQCLGVINAHKTREDTRVLKPITHINEKRAFLAQYMYGDEEELMISSQKVTPQDSGIVIQQSSGAGKFNTSIARITDDDISPTLPNLNQISFLKVPVQWKDCEQRLKSLGFTKLSMVAERQCGYDFDADRSCMCPVCQIRIHDNNQWYIIHIYGSMYLVKNYSIHCKTVLIGLDDDILTQIIKAPKTDSLYADLFVSSVGNHICWTEGKSFMHFNGIRWKRILEEQVQRFVEDVLNSVMKLTVRFLNERRYQIDTNHDMGAEEKKSAKAQAEVDYKNSVLALDIVRRRQNLKHILDIVKTRLVVPQFDELIDRNGWIMGFENGILDLETLQFRQGVPTDMVSFSTGYAYISPEDPEWDENIMEEVVAFIKRIYPVDEEREVIQRYGGYCLLGVHPEKIFVVLTDTRSGYNGKSKFSMCMTAALGKDYSKDGGKCALLYQNDFGDNINSHSAGCLAYDKKRLVIMEELSNTKSLDNEFIKKLNGGSAEFEGRAAYSRQDTNMKWITKMILNCNNRKFPKFDWSDNALLDRLVTIHHRSKFYTQLDEYEQHKDEPYTFMAEGCDDKIAGIWRPYIMQWLLEGLQRWHKERFAVIPTICRDWKRELVSQQDTFTPWFEDHLVKSEDKKDYVTLSSLYEHFKEDCPEERNRKTYIGLKGFSEKLQTLLGPCIMQAKFKVDGEWVRARSLWYGWKYES